MTDIKNLPDLSSVASSLDLIEALAPTYCLSATAGPMADLADQLRRDNGGRLPAGHHGAMVADYLWGATCEAWDDAMPGVLGCRERCRVPAPVSVDGHRNSAKWTARYISALLYVSSELEQDPCSEHVIDWLISERVDSLPGISATPYVPGEPA